MLHVIPQVCFVFNWNISCHACHHVSRYSRCVSISQQFRINGLQESNIKGHRCKRNWNSSWVSIYEFADLWRHQADRRQRHQDEMERGQWCIGDTFGEDLEDFQVYVFTNPACIGLHAGMSHSHSQTWYIRSSHTLILRWWHWLMSVGQRMIPSGYIIISRCDEPHYCNKNIATPKATDLNYQPGLVQT